MDSERIEESLPSTDEIKPTEKYSSTILSNPSLLSFSDKDPSLEILATASIETQSQDALHTNNTSISIPASEVADTVKMRERRHLVIAELLETERGYLNDLNNLVRNVFDPLNNAYLSGVAKVKTKETVNAADIANNTTFGNEETDGWITFDQKQAVIRNGSHLLRAQKLFTKLLEDAISGNAEIEDITNYPERPIITGTSPSDPSVLAISRCFLNMIMKLEAVYLPFCSLHDTAIQTLRVLKKAHPSQFQAFSDECRSNMHSKLEIPDFLIKPVQRICKYPLLLSEIVKSTPIGSRDHAEMQDALQKVKGLVSKINEQKKWAENERKKELLLKRLQPGSFDAFQHIGKALNVTIDKDQKILLNVNGLQQRLGKLMRGSGLLVFSHDSHEMPFVTGITRQSNRELSYYGFFLFAEIIFIVNARKADSYQLVDVIPIQDIINLQELHNEIYGSHESNLMKLKYAWRLTWQVESIYKSVDLGSRSERELRSWLEELSIFISADRISYHRPDGILPPVSGSMGYETTNTRVSKAASTSGSTDAVSLINEDFASDHSIAIQATADLKFSDVFTVESLVLGKVGSSSTHLNGANMAKSPPKSNSGGSVQTSTTIKNLFFTSRNREGGQSLTDKAILSTKKTNRPSMVSNSVTTSKDDLNASVRRVSNLERERSIDISELLAEGETPPKSTPLSISSKLSSMPDLALAASSSGPLALSNEVGRSSQDLRTESAQKSKKSILKGKIMLLGMGKKNSTRSKNTENENNDMGYQVNDGSTEMERSSSVRFHSDRPKTAEEESKDNRKSFFSSLRRSSSSRSASRKSKKEKSNQSSLNDLLDVAEPNKAPIILNAGLSHSSSIHEDIVIQDQAESRIVIERKRSLIPDAVIVFEAIEEVTPRPSQAINVIKEESLSSVTGEKEVSPTVIPTTLTLEDDGEGERTPQPPSARYIQNQNRCTMIPRPPSAAPSIELATSLRFKRRYTKSSGTAKPFSTPATPLLNRNDIPDFTKINHARSYSVGAKEEEHPISDNALVKEAVRRSQGSLLVNDNRQSPMQSIHEQSSADNDIMIMATGTSVDVTTQYILSHSAEDPAFQTPRQSREMPHSEESSTSLAQHGMKSIEHEASSIL